MKCINETCGKEFESNNSRKKFCSGKCKVAYHRKHGNKNEIKPFQMQVLYNQILEVIGTIGQRNELPPAVGAVIIPEKPKWATRDFIKDFSYFNKLIKDLESEDECREFAAEVQASDCSDREKRVLIETLKNKWN